jgi:uncharacterized protein with PhoU and TrkA domain
MEEERKDLLYSAEVHNSKRIVEELEALNENLQRLIAELKD